MKVVLLGARGMLGTDIAREAPANVDLRALGHVECDLTDDVAVASALDAHRPDVVINASAYTAVDRAESERRVAERVNGSAVGRLGEQCAARGIKVVHFSTDYVFSGASQRPYREDDAVAPVNAYGATKLLGERLLRASGATWTILRTQWLFGEAGCSFARTMCERAQARTPSRVVADQYGRPSFTVDVARATWEIVCTGQSGVFHVANAGTTTWFGLAQRIFELAGAAHLVTPCGTADYPTSATRPKFSVLDTSKLESLLGGPLPKWEDAIDRFLSGLAARVDGARTL